MQIRSSNRFVVLMIVSFIVGVGVVAGCAHQQSKVRGSVHTAVVSASDGVPIAYDVRGSGEPALVFVHCWSCDRSFWKEQVDVFADDHTVVTLDLAGHGESGSERELWSVTGLAGDVEAVVEALELERVVLIGHSMGGPVALAAAALMPEQVEAVVAVDTLHDAEAEWSEADRAQIVDAFERDFDGTIEQFVPMLVNDGADPALLEMMIAQGKATDRTAAVELMRDFGNLDLPALMAGANVPIRAINAAPSPPFQPATETDNNRKYADFDVVLMDGVGHYVQLERPVIFNDLLRKVLDELSLAGH